MPSDKTPTHAPNQPLSNTTIIHPSSSDSNSNSNSTSPHHLSPSALFETFWTLQRESTDDAENLMQHVTTCGTFDSASIETWLQTRQLQHHLPPLNSDSPFSPSHSTSSISVDEPVLPTTPTVGNMDVVDMDTSMNMDMDMDIAERIPIALSPSAKSANMRQRTSTIGDTITIATVKRAVDMFFCSTGMLFYIIPKEQQQSLFRAAQEGHGQGSTSLPDTASFTDILRGSTSMAGRARIAEISGMAAIGLLYLRISDEENGHGLPENLSHYFYSITRRMLECAIEVDPMRAPIPSLCLHTARGLRYPFIP